MRPEFVLDPAPSVGLVDHPSDPSGSLAQRSLAQPSLPSTDLPSTDRASTGRPVVSVIMPAFNTASWVVRSMRSVLDQQLRALELLVVDDASTDDTAAVVSAFIESLPADDRERVRLLRQPENQGYGQAVSRGVREARGEWIWCHDADDFADPAQLETMLSRAKETGAQIVMCRMRFVDEDGVPHGLVPQWRPVDGVCTGAEALARLARGQLNGFQSNKIVHSSLWAGGPEPSMNTYADIEYVTQLFARTERVAHCEEAFYSYTQRSGSVTAPLRDSIWDLDLLDRTVEAVLDGDLDPRTARISKLFFRYRQVYWPMLHKAVSHPQAALAPSVAEWVRSRIRFRELAVLAVSGSPGLLIMATLGSAKISPRFHRFIYRKKKANSREAQA